MIDVRNINDHQKKKKNVVKNQLTVMDDITEHLVKIFDNEILDDEILDDEILDDEILSEKDDQIKKEKQQNMFAQTDFDVFNSV